MINLKSKKDQKQHSDGNNYENYIFLVLTTLCPDIHIRKRVKVNIKKDTSFIEHIDKQLNRKRRLYLDEELILAQSLNSAERKHYAEASRNFKRTYNTEVKKFNSLFKVLARKIYLEEYNIIEGEINLLKKELPYFSKHDRQVLPFNCGSDIPLDKTSQNELKPNFNNLTEKGHYTFATTILGNTKGKSKGKDNISISQSCKTEKKGSLIQIVTADEENMSDPISENLKQFTEGPYQSKDSEDEVQLKEITELLKEYTKGHLSVEFNNPFNSNIEDCLSVNINPQLSVLKEKQEKTQDSSELFSSTGKSIEPPINDNCNLFLIKAITNSQPFKKKEKHITKQNTMQNEKSSNTNDSQNTEIRLAFSPAGKGQTGEIDALMVLTGAQLNALLKYLNANPITKGVRIEEGTTYQLIIEITHSMDDFYMKWLQILKLEGLMRTTEELLVHVTLDPKFKTFLSNESEFSSHKQVYLIIANNNKSTFLYHFDERKSQEKNVNKDVSVLIEHILNKHKTNSFPLYIAYQAELSRDFIVRFNNEELGYN
jgi:hypothetical protein